MLCCIVSVDFFFVKQKTAYEMRISDWSSDVCSSDLPGRRRADLHRGGERPVQPRRLLHDHRPLHRQPRADRRRHRRHRTDESQLRPDHPHGRLHSKGDRPAYLEQEKRATGSMKDNTTKKTEETATETTVRPENATA